MKCFPMQVFEKIALFSLRNTVIKIALEVATHKQLVETSKQVTATRTFLMRMKWNKQLLRQPRYLGRAVLDKKNVLLLRSALIDSSHVRLNSHRKKTNLE